VSNAREDAHQQQAADRLVLFPEMSARPTGMKLGAAFAILIAILIGIGILALSRMDQINAHLDDLLARHWAKLQLAREALMYSNQNSRITMEIFLVDDRNLIDPLLARRAANTQKISELLEKIKSQCDSTDECQLLAAVENTRAAYVTSYLQALKLLVDEKQPQAARTTMVQETTPALYRYHDAWSNFMRFQMERMDKAAKEGRTLYGRTRDLLVLLTILAVIVAVTIAFFVTLKMTEEIRTRVLVEREVRVLNVDLEQRVKQRTQELARSNQQLTAEMAERKSLEGQLHLKASALQAAANSIVITDYTGKIVWVNSSFTRLTGYSAEEVHGQNPRLLRSGKQDASFYARLWETISSGEVWHGELTNRRKDGSCYVEEMTITPVRAESGEITHFVAIKQDITSRKAIQEALLHAQEKYRGLVEDAVVGIFQATPDGHIITANSAMARMHGYDSPQQFMSEVSNVVTQLFVNPNQVQEISDLLEKNGVAHDVEVEVYRRDGKKAWLLSNLRGVRGPDGRVVRHEGTVQDITERKAMAQALAEAQERYRTMVEDAVVGIYRTTPDGKFLSVNRALAQMVGYDSTEDFLRNISNATQIYADPKRRDEFRRLITAEGTIRDFEIEIRPRNGKKRTLSLSGRAARGPDGVDLYYEGIVQDMTARKVAEEQVQYLAYYDALTGLPNRTLFRDRLTKALASARRHREKVGLLFFDLDRFKTINDSLGHSVGDLLLREVAERLRKWAREQDTVARLGGDEFVVILTAVKDTADIAVAANRTLSALSAEVAIQGHMLSVTCSLGISVFPDNGTDPETLVKNADAAMYCAKENGNSFQFFTQEMNIRAMERLTVESKLRLALERKELFLVYQPQVDLASGNVVGAEALLRWRHPELGLVPPAKFITVAENSGLIVPFGEWVLRTACAQARQWQDQGLPPLPVSVNVSAVQFRQERFLEVVQRALDDSGLAPQYLELELTESVLLSNGEATLSVLKQLGRMGLRLSIDDFGTGYSSLSYLRHFPVYKLKIDRSFVRAVTINPDDAAIITTIINMAKSLNLKVLAEGVETEEQMFFLRTHHCDEVQGYYFSRPLAAADFAKMQSALFSPSSLQPPSQLM
jgi:diguanylate cyclase (GGDEF)-like protein/PAS domain S-box-containing protein